MTSSHRIQPAQLLFVRSAATHVSSRGKASTRRRTDADTAHHAGRNGDLSFGSSCYVAGEPAASLSRTLGRDDIVRRESRGARPACHQPHLPPDVRVSADSPAAQAAERPR